MTAVGAPPPLDTRDRPEPDARSNTITLSRRPGQIETTAELAALRETTIGRAEELLALERERFDQMVAGLWPLIERGTRQPCQRRFASVSAARDYWVSTLRL